MHWNKDKQIVKRYHELTSFIRNKNDIKILLLCMYQLTPTGFEHYIAGYLKIAEKYNQVNVNGGIHDMGFDIVCKNNNIYAVAQCKKYETNNVAVKDILYFDRCTKKIIPRQQQNLRKYFITTNRCNPQSKEVAKELGIHLRDYHKIIYDIQKHYPIEQFLHVHKKNAKLVVQKYVLSGLTNELSVSNNQISVKKQHSTISHIYNNKLAYA